MPQIFSIGGYVKIMASFICDEWQKHFEDISFYC